MNYVGNFDTGLNTILNDYVKKPTMIRGLVHLLLILYVARLAPTPPKAVLQLFDNVYFKLFIFSLVLWTAQFSPSTSILIALAFMVTVNYTTTGKLWEMMDNIGAEQVPTSVDSAVEAVKVLAQAAVSSDASSPSVIAPLANIAASAASTAEGVNAIKALAEQAVTSAPGTPENVSMAVNTAVGSIVPGQEQELQQVPVTQNQAVLAIQALASAATSEVPIPVKDVAPVVEIALAAASTKEGSDAIKALGQQAITAEAGVAEKVNTAVQVAMDSIAPKSDTGCFPMRQYDMSKVSSQTDGKLSFEDYQTFTSQ